MLIFFMIQFRKLKIMEKIMRRIMMLLLMVLFGVNVSGVVVSSEVSNPDTSIWSDSGGSFAVDISASDFKIDAKNVRGISAKVNIPGNGFGVATFKPEGMSASGNLKSVEILSKINMTKYGVFLRFNDGNGQNVVDGNKLNSVIKYKGIIGQWQKTEFVIPDDWVQPVEFIGIMVWNWEAKTVKAQPVVDIAGLKLNVDIADDVKKEDLLSVSCDSGLMRNVFTTSMPPKYKLMVSTWDSENLKGSVKYTVSDYSSGKVVDAGEFKLENKRALCLDIELKVNKFGVYNFEAVVNVEGIKEIKESSRFAYVPTPNVLTEKDKKYSPYGMDIHSGIDGVAYQQIADLGVVWARDFGFSRNWMVRARGQNGNYEGWPFYRSKLPKIDAAGLIIAPVLMGMIGNAPKDGTTVPDKEWARDLSHFLWAFPNITSWEIDNECDLHDKRLAGDSEIYKGYHKRFGEIVNTLDENLWAVENGTAGVHPDKLKIAIDEGAFDNIDVVNAHFYCGTAIPELSTRNANTGQAGEAPSLMRDTLREFSKVADSDGKDRQAWITEFGWDTLAVHIVTEYEQAAYLQRGYLMGLNAGLDKMFWYWNLDTKGIPGGFFDGCGVFSGKDEPKPAAVAYSAMAKMLPNPKPLGSFDVGEGTLGYLFASEGKLVAAVFKLYEDGPSTMQKIGSGVVYDYYGNKIEGNSFKLQVAPTWIVGIDAKETMLKGTACDIISSSYIRASAGDKFVSTIKVDPSKYLTKNSTISADLPNGWELVKRDVVSSENSDMNFNIQIRIAADSKRGFYDVVFAMKDGDYVQYFPIQVEVLDAASIKVYPLQGTFDNSTLKVQIKNNSMYDKTFMFKSEIPSSWSVEPQNLKLDMKAKETVIQEFKVKWNVEDIQKTKAMLQIADVDGTVLAAEGIIPNQLIIPKVSDIKFDGNLSDWPKGSKIPSWTLGCIGQDANVDLYVAYGKKGIYLAFEVQDGLKAQVIPESFWNSDVLEVIVDTKVDSTDRNEYAKTDHQFWICPLVDSKSVYLGRWKRNSEIAETQFDIKSVEGVSMLRKPGSYVVEVLIPAEAITGFNPDVKTLGLNLNLTISGEKSKREVFWIYDKPSGVIQKPGKIGRVIIK
jgi:hypothetical protein